MEEHSPKPTLAKIGSGDGRKEPLHLADGFYFEPRHFILPVHYRRDISKVLIPSGFIQSRIEKLAYDIVDFYKNEEVVHFVCILKGSRSFFHHLLSLMSKIHTYTCGKTRKATPYQDHFVRLKTYVGTKSSGTLNLDVISEDLKCLRAQHVVIVEDIIDTGHTLSRFCEYMRTEIQPKTMAVASLLEKRTSRSNGFKGDFVGFSVPDEFIVGFCLDYNEMYRDVEHICVLGSEAAARHS